METRPGTRTTEFWLILIGANIMPIALALTGILDPKWTALVMGVANGLYAVSRGAREARRAARVMPTSRDLDDIMVGEQEVSEQGFIAQDWLKLAAPIVLGLLLSLGAFYRVVVTEDKLEKFKSDHLMPLQERVKAMETCYEGFGEKLGKISTDVSVLQVSSKSLENALNRQEQVLRDFSTELKALIRELSTRIDQRGFQPMPRSHFDGGLDGHPPTVPATTAPPASTDPSAPPVP